jgi:hypothetical protein
MAALRLLEREVPYPQLVPGWLGLVMLSVPLIGVLFARPRQDTSASRWGRAIIPPLAFVAAALLAIAHYAMVSSARPYAPPRLLHFAEKSFDFFALNLASIPTWLALIVLMDTLRRGALSARDRTLRLGIAASALLLLPSLARGFFAWACSSPVVSAEAATFHASDQLPFAFACHATAAVSLAVALVPSREQASRQALLPLIGLLVLSTSALGVDVATADAIALLERASDEVPRVPYAARMARSALAADVFGGAGAILALALFVYAASHRIASHVRASRSRGHRAIAPLLPLYFLFTTLALAPETYARFPQQHPEAIWEDADDFVPLTRPGRGGWIPEHLDGLIRRETGVRLSLHGGTANLSLMEFVTPSPRDRHGPVLVPDARATLSSLETAAWSLRMFDGVSLAWRFENLDEAPRARARWPFVEMSNRALRSRFITFMDEPLACPEGPDVVYAEAHFRRCTRQARSDESESVLLLKNDDDVLLSDWLDATEDVHERFALRVNRALDLTWQSDAYFRPTRNTSPLNFHSRELWLVFPIGLALGVLAALRARRQALPQETATQLLRALWKALPVWRDGIARWVLLFVAVIALAWAMRAWIS